VTSPPGPDAATPLRAVFLDIGDTIMRPNPSWEHVYALAFEEFGVSVSIEDLHRALREAYHHGGWGMQEGFEPSEETSFRRTVEIDAAAIAALGIGPMPDEFYRRLAEMFLVTSHWHIFPDAYGALSGLRERGLTIGAVSNWVWNLPELLHALDLVGGFDFIAASARIGYEKPHPRIFEWALEQAGTTPDAVIHVGDHIGADVEGALAVGITPVLIDRFERHTADELPAGVPRITTLDELMPLVDARLGGARAA
jgi:HAD superfamily hydrolase (TIGR01549 family)